MSIYLRKAGILTTVQDLGRVGYRRFGVNPGGVMDHTAARLINILAGNDENAAVLEIHFPAAEIVFEAACTFAIGGAVFSPNLDDRPNENWRTYDANAGSVLKFAEKTLGNRAYLAIGGGFDGDQWLGSRSTNTTAGLGGFDGRKLQIGDHVAFRSSATAAAGPGRRISQTLIPRYSPFPTVRVIAGGEYEMLTADSKRLLVVQDFTVSNNSNRMGFRLEGEPLSLDEPVEMVSSAASFGTVQLLPDGQLIVLMADHQTSGGYPRIAHIISRDLPVMAQLGGRDKVAFHLVSLADAENLNAELERDIARFRIACSSPRKN